MQNGMNQMGGGGGGVDPSQQQQQQPGQQQQQVAADNYSALGLNVDPNMDWRDIRYRQKVSSINRTSNFIISQIRHQIDEQLRNVGQSTPLDQGGQKSVEWETQVFNRSKTQEEYVKLVATLIMKLRDYKAKVNI